MKKYHKALLTLLPSFFVLALAIPAASVFAPAPDEVGEDPAIYDESLEHAKLEAPDITNIHRAGDDEEEEPAVEVNKVTLHYFNEAADCDKRAFYLWVTGVDGIEYSPELNGEDIVTVSTDKTMMTITVDFTDARFTEFANRSGLWFIIKFRRIGTNLNWGGQSDDMFLRYEDFADKIGDSKHCEVWAMPAAGGGIAILDMEEKTRVPGIKLASFSDWKTITCETTADTGSKIWWKLYAFDETYFKIKVKKREENKHKYLVLQKDDQNVPANKQFTINFKYEAHPNIVYQLESHDPNSDSIQGMGELNKLTTIGFTTLYDSAKFHTLYEDAHANVKDFGMTYTAQGTTFKVWSPMSANITLMLYDTDTSAEFGGDDKYKGYHMHYTKGGIWELTVDGDLAGKYYNYQVDNTLGTNTCMDPYATSAGANGVRGFVYDKNAATAKPEGWDNLPLKWDGEIEKGLDIATPQELSIYEVHLQDFTGDESWVSNNNIKRGTYNAFVESGTKVAGTDIPTGYDHLNELGVKAVQLMPMFDHDNDESKATLKYNWGYNPLNYNVVEGGYSSNAHDGLARVKEFRNLVLEMSKTEVHTRVIMDVVYNHVSSATGSAFHKLMPRYYFRYSAKDYYYIEGQRGDYFEENGKMYYWENGQKLEGPTGATYVKYQFAGELFDGSGCHNEVASDRRMMRKFIIDSLCMWARDYKVKGFRFDLMGLLDTQTMNDARKALTEIDPDIYIYGEGWTSGGYHGDGTVFADQAHATEAPRSGAMAGEAHACGNFSAETWQIYHDCNAWKVPSKRDDSHNADKNGVYLGGFNDSYRNGIRGQNDGGGHYPGAGLLQSGQAGDQAWSTAQGLWGAWVNGYDSKGFYPEQTVNYVSCHDNYTARDQFYNTMHDGSPASAEDMLRASIQAHALTMAGNSAAFILGGEELLRTKELTDADVENIGKTVAEGDVVEMHGHKISHNSYNLSVECNSFKWGNKVEIDVNNTKVTDAVFHYNDAFKTLVRMHNQRTFKRGINLENSQNPYDDFIKVTSTGKTVQNATWGGGNDGAWEGAGLAMQSDEVLIYMQLNGENGYIWGDSRIIATGDTKWTEMFRYGYSSYDSEANKINFGGERNAIIIYNAYGRL